MFRNNVSNDMLCLTAQIVAAHLSKNKVEASRLPELVHDVFRALTTAAVESTAVTAGLRERPQPAVPVGASVFPEHIVCLEDGKKLQRLKWHLLAYYDLTPAQYRERWDLPPDYPMVAEHYAKRRSVLAKRMGLGRKPNTGPAQAGKPCRRRSHPKSNGAPDRWSGTAEANSNWPPG